MSRTSKTMIEAPGAGGTPRKDLKKKPFYFFAGDLFLTQCSWINLYLVVVVVVVRVYTWWW